ncbi:MAG: hypothetical protein Q9M40_02375 [Sulfurimonas sp.]|nr:hypothetical protein [Sulfurimonas sp.]
MKYYAQSKGVDTVYIDTLLDAMGGIKVDNSYNTNIFDENSYLFRDYVASSKHLAKINDFYTQEYNDNSIKKINIENLLYFTKDANTTIDVNHATVEVWG